MSPHGDTIDPTAIQLSAPQLLCAGPSTCPSPAGWQRQGFVDARDVTRAWGCTLDSEIRDEAVAGRRRIRVSCRTESGQPPHTASMMSSTSLPTASTAPPNIQQTCTLRVGMCVDLPGVEVEVRHVQSSRHGCRTLPYLFA